MNFTSLTTIYDWFKSRKKPTEAQFRATWNSFWHKSEKIPVAQIDGIDELLAEQADADLLETHINNEDRHLSSGQVNDINKISDLEATVQDKASTSELAAHMSDDERHVTTELLNQIDEIDNKEDKANKVLMPAVWGHNMPEIPFEEANEKYPAFSTFEQYMRRVYEALVEQRNFNGLLIKDITYKTIGSGTVDFDGTTIIWQKFDRKIHINKNTLSHFNSGSGLFNSRTTLLENKKGQIVKWVFVEKHTLTSTRYEDDMTIFIESAHQNEEHPDYITLNASSGTRLFNSNINDTNYSSNSIYVIESIVDASQLTKLSELDDDLGISNKTEKGGYNGTSQDLYDRIGLNKDHIINLRSSGGDIYQISNILNDFEFPGNFVNKNWDGYNIVYGASGSTGFLYIRKSIVNFAFNPEFITAYGSIYRITLFRTSEVGFGRISYRYIDVYGGATDLNDDFYVFQMKRLYSNEGNLQVTGNIHNSYTHLTENYIKNVPNVYSTKGTIVLNSNTNTYIDFIGNYHSEFDFDKALKGALLLPKGKRIVSIELSIKSALPINSTLRLAYNKKDDGIGVSFGSVEHFDLVESIDGYRYSFKDTSQDLSNFQSDQMFAFMINANPSLEDVMTLEIESFKITID